MMMNSEDFVGNIRNFLLNLNDEDTTVYFRDFVDGELRESERSPSTMSSFLANRFYDQKKKLYVSIYPYASHMDVVIHTYER